MKEWFILIDDKSEGPYSFEELKQHPRVTPDTLVWKEGLEQWVAIRQVPELKDLFKDEPKGIPIQDRIKPKAPANETQPEDTLTLETDPSPYFFWLIIILIILSYFIFYYRP